MEKHTYDEADRLIDSGTSYEAFGNITSLPAADAGGSGLTSTYYVDNQLASQTQAKEMIGYNLDPANRTNEIISTGNTAATETQNYAGPGSTPSWTSEPSGAWKSNISSMTGLSATEHNGEAPVLELTNLHGDIVATASNSETASSLSSPVREASDYGVPAAETPLPYAWLGSHETRTELPSGIVAMGARSYVSELGRFLQTDPRAGGSANAYTYTYGYPINTTDLTGEYTAEIDQFDEETVSKKAQQATEARTAEIRAAEEAAARAAAEKAAEIAATLAAYATAAAPPEPKWAEEYAMGGPSLTEIYAAEGVIPGGGMQEEESYGGFVNDEDPATGCTHGPCKGKGGSPNEGGCPSGSRGRAAAATEAAVPAAVSG